MKRSRGQGTIPEGWWLVRLGDVAQVAFSGVDKRTIEGEVSVKLCNYTDVFYNRRIQASMDFMSATATQSELKRWALKQGDVLFTKDSETADEIGIPAFVATDLPNVLCGYHLGLARPSQATVNGSFLAKPKPRWDVHLPEVGGRAGSLAGGIQPLIAGPCGSGA